MNAIFGKTNLKTDSLQVGEHQLEKAVEHTLRSTSFAVGMQRSMFSYKTHLVQNELGCQVVWCPAEGVRSFAVGKHLSKAQVGDLDVAFDVQQQVLWLHASATQVQHPSRVANASTQRV